MNLNPVLAELELWAASVPTATSQKSLSGAESRRLLAPVASVRRRLAIAVVSVGVKLDRDAALAHSIQTA